MQLTYIAACVDASRTVILGPFSPLLAGESFDACSKAVELILVVTQVFFFLLAYLLYYQWGSLGPLRMMVELI